MKKQIYLQSKNDSTDNKSFEEQISDHKLQPGNNLYVRIVSLESEVSDFFNMGYSSSGNIYYDAAIYLNSYSVNDSGYIDMPYIRNIYVKDLTLEEAKEKIQEQIDLYLYNTMVIVKIVNYNVTVIGEVVRPGQYKVYQDRINIFEVLGLAGDLTTYAKRDDVVLVRKIGKKTTMYSIDLLDENVFESEYYYIMPNDIIYIKPVKGKNFAYSAFPYTLIISSISLIIALIAIIK